MTQAKKADHGKLPMDLLDPQWLEGVTRVLQFGARKYSAHNWRAGIAYSRLYAAAQRHLNAFAQGQETDDETGLSHLLHASCCLMFLYNMQQTRRDLNDLYWASDVAQRAEGKTHAIESTHDAQCTLAGSRRRSPAAQHQTESAHQIWHSSVRGIPGRVSHWLGLLPEDSGKYQVKNGGSS